MTESRKKADWLVVAALVLGFVFVASAFYVGGYLALSSRINVQVTGLRAGGKVLRTFNSEWQAKFFRPVAKLEERAVGKEVILAWMEE